MEREGEGEGENLQCIHSADLVRESDSFEEGEGLWQNSNLPLLLESLGVLVTMRSVPVPPTGDRFPFCIPDLLLLLPPLACCFFPDVKNPSAMSIPDSPLLRLLQLPSDWSASSASKCSNISSDDGLPKSVVVISLMVLSMVVGESDPVLLKLRLLLAGVKGDSEIKTRKG